MGLRKLAEKMDAALQGHELASRIGLFSHSAENDKARMSRLVAEMQWTAEVLAGSANLKVRKIRSDNPNPQVQFTLYLVDWIRFGTGTPRYEDLTALLTLPAAELTTTVNVGGGE